MKTITEIWQMYRDLVSDFGVTGPPLSTCSFDVSSDYADTVVAFLAVASAVDHPEKLPTAELLFLETAVTQLREAFEKQRTELVAE